MSDHVVLLSLPGLREEDVQRMPHLQRQMAAGGAAQLSPSFPCVTWPVQANMLTGKLPREHGVTANGFFWRDKAQVEMWTAWNEKIQAPQIWDLLHRHNPEITSAVWFPMLSKGCGADYICMPAPIHNPDGSESLWCYTKPVELYGELRDACGHFPLKHFWGPLSNIQSTAWIVESAILAAARFRPNFFYLYLPHLDYAAQKMGPSSEQAVAAVGELDQVLGKLFAGLEDSLQGDNLLWLAASEYTIVDVNHVTYPNRMLREAGLLTVVEKDGGGELIDFSHTPAWALVDHQFSHVYVRNAQDVSRVAATFRDVAGIAEVLVGDERAKYELDHERSGEIVLISTPNSWQAYYWWLEDGRAPSFARTVDIHRKPGYDPVELHVDMATRSTPLDATLIKGSHGAPARDESQCGVILSSQPGVLDHQVIADTDVCDLVLRQFGI